MTNPIITYTMTFTVRPSFARPSYATNFTTTYVTNLTLIYVTTFTVRPSFVWASSVTNSNMTYTIDGSPPQQTPTATGKYCSTI